LLGLFGVDDKFPAPPAVATLDAELTKLDKAHEFHSYEGAGHSFFSVDRPAYRPRRPSTAGVASTNFSPPT